MKARSAIERRKWFGGLGIVSVIALMAIGGANCVTPRPALDVFGGDAALPGEDAALDSGAVSDAGADARIDATAPSGSGPPIDSGADGGKTDASTPADAASDATTDAPTDAADHSSDASACGACSDAQVCACGACVTPITFSPVDSGLTNPILNVNTVATIADGGQPLTTVDGFTQFGTASYFASIGFDAGGLPDDAFFASACPNLPQAQLYWTNAQNVLNSTLVSSGSIAFDVPAAEYSVLQLYALSTTGAGSIAVTLNYATGSPVTPPSIPVNDWCSAPEDGGAYVLVTAARASDQLACHIYALDLALDNTRALTSVSIVYTEVTNPGEQTFVFYGASAW